MAGLVRVDSRACRLEQAQAVQDARAAAEAQVEKARAELAAEVESAKASLRTESETLAEEIAGAVLQRRAS